MSQFSREMRGFRERESSRAAACILDEPHCGCKREPQRDAKARFRGEFAPFPRRSRKKGWILGDFFIDKRARAFYSSHLTCIPTSQENLREDFNDQEQERQEQGN